MRKLIPLEEKVVELIDTRGFTDFGNKILLTCEHASNHLPEPYSWHEDDLQFKDTHWGYDIGAREATIELAHKIGSVALLTKVSRLLIDFNRLVCSDSLIRTHCDGVQLQLNKELDVHERYRRINDFHVPFYHVLGEVTGHVDPEFVFSVHTFTPNYQGSIREVQIGVLHEDENRDIAHHMVKELRYQGFDARYNEPWSGEKGIMAGNVAARSYNMDRPRTRGIELEIRNDLASDPGTRGSIVHILSEMIPEIYHKFCKKAI